MAIEVPSFDELMWPALQALKAMGGSATNEELLQKVIEIGGYPPEVQNFLHTDNRQTKLNYNLAWARTYLKLAGAVTNSQRGVWSIAEKGEALTEGDVAAIPRQIRKTYGRKKPDPGSPATSAATEPEQEDEGWRAKLLNILMAMRPDGFERLSQRVLRESGFIKVQVTGRSGDGGIDGLGVLRVALLSFQVSFQCKRYKGECRPFSHSRFSGSDGGAQRQGSFYNYRNLHCRSAEGSDSRWRSRH